VWRHIICGPSGCSEFLVISSRTARFSENVCDMEFAFWFSLQHSIAFLPSSRRLQWDTIVNVRSCLCKSRVLSYLKQTSVYCTHISKNSQNKISRESLKWKANYFTRMDGQTGRHTHTHKHTVVTKLIIVDNYHATNKCTNCMSFIFKSLF